MNTLLKHKSIFFHEDYYSQIELIPEENYFHSKKQIDSLPNNDSLLFGFNDCIARDGEPIKILTRNISLEKIRAILKPLATSFSDHILAGYGSSSYRLKNCEVWGFNYYGIFVEHKNDTVQKIWIWTHGDFATSNSASNLRDALWQISNNFNLILVDWNRELIVRFKKNIGINSYLHEYLDFNPLL